MRTCSVDGCGRPHYAKGHCKTHYMTEWHAKQSPKPRKHRKPRRPQTLLGGYSDDRENVPRGGSTVLHWPARPKRITDALHALAETPGLTEREYLRRKHEILRGATP